MSDNPLYQRVQAFEQARANLHATERATNREIGDLFKSLRSSKKISLRKLSAAMGVSHTMVVAWERGETFWTTEIAGRYLEACQ